MERNRKYLIAVAVVFTTGCALEEAAPLTMEDLTSTDVGAADHWGAETLRGFLHCRGLVGFAPNCPTHGTAPLYSSQLAGASQIVDLSSFHVLFGASMEIRDHFHPLYSTGLDGYRSYMVQVQLNPIVEEEDEDLQGLYIVGLFHEEDGSANTTPYLRRLDPLEDAETIGELLDTRFDVQPSAYYRIQRVDGRITNIMRPTPGGGFTSVGSCQAGFVFPHFGADNYYSTFEPGDGRQVMLTMFRLDFQHHYR